jgi:hypothetical protein
VVAVEDQVVALTVAVVAAAAVAAASDLRSRLPRFWSATFSWRCSGAWEVLPVCERFVED